MTRFAPTWTTDGPGPRAGDRHGLAGLTTLTLTTPAPAANECCALDPATAAGGPSPVQGRGEHLRPRRRQRRL